MKAQAASQQRAPAAVDFAALPRVRERTDVKLETLPVQAFLSGSEPVLLRGLVADWPEVSMTPAQLLASIGAEASEAPLPFYTAPADACGRVFYNESMNGFNFQRRSGRLRDCCEWLAANADREDAGMLYVGSTAVERWLPDFEAAHPLDLGREPSICSLWLGNRTRIAAHYDFPGNLACVLAGRRRFTLFPPECLMELHIGPLEHTPSGQPISLVDFHAVDEARFPRFAQALERAQVAELDAGDALFIPSMWWHHVEAFAAVNLLINYWWRDSALHLGSPQLALLHAALAIGQLDEKERGPWARMFEQLVFRRDEADWGHLERSDRGVLGEINEAQARQLRQHLAKQLQL
ncbi:MAG: cupin-like domain-containing protein [Halieaceae bacterium]|jgi:hypothetical protein|nr:cupin-like domain-containing protein [Halieaceae bacterium]